MAIRAVKAKDRSYKCTDGRGLYIEVRPTGAKPWRYKYLFDPRL
ncbi:Arm DNA-binding domain-containing protein [Sphingosinicella soli]